jgi:hypothetical protein
MTITGGGSPVMVMGTNLGGATAVYFGTTPAIIQGISPSSVSVMLPAHAAGTVDVTVVTPAGTSPTSPADQFTYQGGVGSGGPVILTVSPKSGPTTGGLPALIYGSNLDGAIAVYFGTTAAAIVSDNATTMEVRLPAHAAGTVDVTVVTPNGTSPLSPQDQFTFTSGGLPPSFQASMQPSASPSAQAATSPPAPSSAAVANALLGTGTDGLDMFFINRKVRRIS